MLRVETGERSTSSFRLVEAGLWNVAVLWIMSLLNAISRKAGGNLLKSRATSFSTGLPPKCKTFVHMRMQFTWQILVDVDWTNNHLQSQCRGRVFKVRLGFMCLSYSYWCLWYLPMCSQWLESPYLHGTFASRQCLAKVLCKNVDVIMRLKPKRNGRPKFWIV